MKEWLNHASRWSSYAILEYLQFFHMSIGGFGGRKTKTGQTAFVPRGDFVL